MNVSLDEVKKNLEMRDHEDTHREHNPLQQAHDAIVLDNSHLNLDEQLVFAEKLVQGKIR